MRRDKTTPKNDTGKNDTGQKTTPGMAGPKNNQHKIETGDMGR
jgi:hypothetical protein